MKVLVIEISKCLEERTLQRSQISGDVRAEMHAERAAVALHQHLEVPSCLGRLDHAEGVLPVRAPADRRRRRT